MSTSDVVILGTEEFAVPVTGKAAEVLHLQSSRSGIGHSLGSEPPEACHVS